MKWVGWRAVFFDRDIIMLGGWGMTFTPKGWRLLGVVDELLQTDWEVFIEGMEYLAGDIWWFYDF